MNKNVIPSYELKSHEQEIIFYRPPWYTLTQKKSSVSKTAFLPQQIVSPLWNTLDNEA